MPASMFLLILRCIRTCECSYLKFYRCVFVCKHFNFYENLYLYFYTHVYTSVCMLIHG